MQVKELLRDEAVEVWKVRRDGMIGAVQDG